MRLAVILVAALAFTGLSATTPAAAESTSLRVIAPTAAPGAITPSAEQYRSRSRYGYRPGHRSAWRNRYYRPAYRYGWRGRSYRPNYRFGYRSAYRPSYRYGYRPTYRPAYRYGGYGHRSGWRRR